VTIAGPPELYAPDLPWPDPPVAVRSDQLEPASRDAADGDGADLSAGGGQERSDDQQPSDDQPAAPPPPVVELPGAHAGSVTGAVLRIVAGGLVRAGIEHFLVATGRSGSRVGVPLDELHRVVDTLRHLAVGTTLQARVETGDTVTWTGPAEDLPTLDSTPPPTRIKLFAHVRDPVSGLELGRRQGCWVELWPPTDRGGLAAPVWNPDTGEVSAADRAGPGRRSLPGGDVRSIPPFLDRGVFEVGFPIDAVVTWVDGSDPDWQRRRAERLAELGGEADTAEVGLDERYFRDNGELRYLLRSIERYAPWLRHVYLVTDAQRPEWLVAEHPALTVVDHTDIIEASALPVFSSRPLSARLHRIEGLSEHFLYLNDDVVLGRTVTPELFFTASGLTRFFLSRAQTPRDPSELPHLGGRQYVARLLRESYGVDVSRTFFHTPYAMTRRIFQTMERRFGVELDRVVQQPFRGPDAIVPDWMSHYLGYLEGTAIPGEISYDYFRVGHGRSMRRLAALSDNRRLDCFVLNDEDHRELDDPTAVLREHLERLLPGPSSFERPPGPGSDPR
jgi:hypothetical protein